jgi:hypothetical protein
MKKVLSAVVLSAAVVATAGQAQAYDDFNIGTDEDLSRGTMMGILYTANTEIILNLGNFKTANNDVDFDHQFTETDKVLATVDYKSILAQRGDTGEVHMSYLINDMVGAVWSPRYWDAYYATTSQTHGGETPSYNGSTAGDYDSLNPFLNWDMLITNAYKGANKLGSDDVMVMEVDNEWSWHLNGNFTPDYFPEPGTYAGINEVSAAWGEADFNEYATQCEIDMYLWQVRHDTNFREEPDYGVNSSLGIAATLRFDQRTGAITLNPTDAAETCPVPVPAAAWLLGSGVLGLFGLRRRNA